MKENLDNNLKILFMEWDSMGNIYIQKAMQDAGFEVIKMDFPQKTEDTRMSPELTEKILKQIMSDTYAFVFSFNYFPVIAMACKACRVKYLSWIYDSPFIQLYSKTVFYDTNYIFHFDRAECIKLRNQGVEHIYYLPMAAPADVYDTYDLNVLSAKERDYYTSDISFVGSMYTEKKQQLYSHFDDLDDYTKGYMECIAQAQKKVYGCNFLEEVLTEPIIEKLLKAAPIRQNGDGFETLAWVYANYFVARKIAAMERQEIMELLSEEFQVKLFTHEQTKELPRVKNMGKVDYYDQCPYVFKGAKINLNISLRSIQTGIPLRAMDIMGCGGFLLTNFQLDFLEHFVPDEDFVYYESMDDLKEKVHYYLYHEEKRKQIAWNGYRKVKQQHTFSRRLEEMLQIAFSS